jgi:hypothetical protein
MSLDVVAALALCNAGENYQPPPFWVEGVFVEPPVQTRSSQATGAAGATVLRAAYTAGRVKMNGRVADVAGAEATLVSQNGYLTSGQAVWFTLVAVQHRPSSAINLIWVPGTVAALASVAKPTHAQIVDALDLDDRPSYVICGSLRFYRVSDLVIVHAASDVQRPAYVDSANKTEIVYDESDQSNMAEVAGSTIEVQVGLVQMSGVAAGSLYMDGIPLPAWPFGGKIESMHYIPAVNGTGAGATQDVVLGIDGTALTGGVLTLTLANAVIPTPVAATAITAANKFKAGATLDVETDNTGTDFTAGSGTLRVVLKRFVRR